MTVTKQRTRTWRLMAAFLALVMVLAACGNGDDVAEPPAPEPDEEEPTDEGAEEEPEPDAGEPEQAAPELERVGPVNFGSIGIVPIYSMLVTLVAESGGFFDKYEVDVEVRPMETGVDAARAVSSGDLDVAFSPTGPVMTFAGTGVDVAAIFGMDNIDWLIASANPEVQTCEDLAGETIAVDSVGGARYNVLQVILRSCDLTIDDVETASFPAATALQAVAAGQIDTSVLHIDDIYVTEELGQPLQIVTFLADIDPLQHYLVFWTLRSNLDEDREAYVRVLAAVIDAIRFINDPANEDQVIEWAAPIGHSPEVLRESLADFIELEYWPVDRDGLGQEKMEAAIATQVRVGNLEEGDAPEYQDVVDLSLFGDALELVNLVNG